jgi:2,4-dienoyl-CoA reductase-like NADH-dependent reductase (Old Yellow Enzyme family)
LLYGSPENCIDVINLDRNGNKKSYIYTNDCTIDCIDKGGTMSEHQRFHYKTAEEFKADSMRYSDGLPWSDDLSILGKPVVIGDKRAPNSMAVNPMEGCDGTADGKPGELTLRRYERFARGGAGLLWLEACAVVHEGRANPRQPYLTESNYDAFAEMTDLIYTSASSEFGTDFRPYTVIQLTHSGRYSRPDSGPAPIIAARNPYLDKNLGDDYPVITDGELEALEDKYVEAALMAQRLGYDAVDVKCCHRYLISELLSAFTRDGNYGGSFENRTRFLLNIVDKIRDRAGASLGISLRMNAYDSIPYPYGWGVSQEDVHTPDLSEPIKLVGMLEKRGVQLVNVSCGNPYYNPHVNRPYDKGPYTPLFHQLDNVTSLLTIARDIQKAVPGIVLISTGYSWLREFGAHVAAGCLKEGWSTMAGFGRQAFAYPDFAKDILQNGGMDRKKCCLACSNCTDIMRDGGMTGCVPKDPEVYAPIFKRGREGKAPVDGSRLAEHI